MPVVCGPTTVALTLRFERLQCSDCRAPVLSAARQRGLLVRVELHAGRLLLNMRNYDPSISARAFAHSDDGGETWSALQRDPVLVEPRCQASIRRSGDHLLFSNPASAEARQNMPVRLSTDEGRTWPHSRTLYPGPAAYSCLAALPDGRAACLYECGAEQPYERLTLARFAPDWVRDAL